MKKFVAIILLASPLCFADVHAASRSMKYAATLSPAKAAKDAGKGSYFLAKHSLKLAYFPFRHSIKTSKGLYKAGKQVF